MAIAPIESAADKDRYAASRTIGCSPARPTA